MLSRSLTVLVAVATTTVAQSGQTPECLAVSDVSNLLRIGDEGLRYCSSILSIGTIADPVYSTLTAILTRTITDVTLTDTDIVTQILSYGTSYLTASSTVTTTTTIATS